MIRRSLIAAIAIVRNATDGYRLCGVALAEVTAPCSLHPKRWRQTPPTTGKRHAQQGHAEDVPGVCSSSGRRSARRRSADYTTRPGGGGGRQNAEGSGRTHHSRLPHPQAGRRAAGWKQRVLYPSIEHARWRARHRSRAGGPPRSSGNFLRLAQHGLQARRRGAARRLLGLGSLRTDRGPGYRQSRP